MLSSTFIDEVGYVPLADIGAEFLFQVISGNLQLMVERADGVLVKGHRTRNPRCEVPTERSRADRS
jgi:hypothetical protein